MVIWCILQARLPQIILPLMCNNVVIGNALIHNLIPPVPLLL